MKLIADKCKMLYLGKHDQKQKYRMGDNWLGSCSDVKDLGGLVNHKVQLDSTMY